MKRRGKRNARAAFSRPRFRRRRWMFLAACCIIALLITLDHRGWLLVRSSDDLARYHGVWVRVARVVDGDTIDIAVADEMNQGSMTTRIRLWGIDCPELAAFDRPEQPWAAEATRQAREIVDGREVLLFLEPQRERDSYGRVLAHIELRDGRSLNELLLEAGLARADDRWPHARLTRYAQVELLARRAQRGMWSPTNAGQQ